jgi:hypothetical protein
LVWLFGTYHILLVCKAQPFHLSGGSNPLGLAVGNGAPVFRMGQGTLFDKS